MNKKKQPWTLEQRQWLMRHLGATLEPKYGWVITSKNCPTDTVLNEFSDDKLPIFNKRFGTSRSLSSFATQVRLTFSRQSNDSKWGKDSNTRIKNRQILLEHGGIKITMKNKPIKMEK